MPVYTMINLLKPEIKLNQDVRPRFVKVTVTISHLTQSISNCCSQINVKLKLKKNKQDKEIIFSDTFKPLAIDDLEKTFDTDFSLDDNIMENLKDYSIIIKFINKKLKLIN